MNKESIFIREDGKELISEHDLANLLAQLGSTQQELEELQKLVVDLFNMFSCGVNRDIIFEHVMKYADTHLTEEQQGELI